MMKKILIVDDEADFCFFIKQNLEASGDFKVLVCSDSAVAVSRVKEHHPDLILLDVLMPGKSGPEIAEELKGSQETQAIPLVFLTAVVTGEETADRKNRVGGQYMIAKPVQIKELIRVIEVALAQRGVADAP